MAETKIPVASLEEEEAWGTLFRERPSPGSASGIARPSKSVWRLTSWRVGARIMYSTPPIFAARLLSRRIVGKMPAKIKRSRAGKASHVAQ